MMPHVVNAGARLDRLPMSAFHWKTLGLVGAGMFLDAFELTMASGVLGALIKEGWSDLAHNAAFISVTFAGMVLGAWFAGILGDRFGRSFCYRVNLLLFGIPSIAAAFAPSMDWLIGARFLMGLGMGAEIVVGFVTLSEFVPPGPRGRAGATLSAMMNSAVFLSAFAGYLIIPEIGWRWMFAIVGGCALVVWAFRQGLPESPRWLESKGRLAEAQQVLERIEREVGCSSPVVTMDGTPVSSSRHVPLRQLFSRGLISRTLVGGTLLVALNTFFFSFAAWLPTFFVKQGLTVSASLGFNALMSAGAPVGALIGVWLSDRVPRKKSIALLCTIMAMLAVVYPNVSSTAVLLTVGFVLLTTAYTVAALSFAVYVPELFPTELRMRGAGFCNTMGRAAVVLTPYLVVPLFQSVGIGGVIALVVGCLLLAALVVATFGVETRQVALEKLNPSLKSI
jgi:putative MFS transporter